MDIMHIALAVLHQKHFRLQLVVQMMKDDLMLKKKNVPSTPAGTLEKLSTESEASAVAGLEGNVVTFVCWQCTGLPETEPKVKILESINPSNAIDS